MQIHVNTEEAEERRGRRRGRVKAGRLSSQALFAIYGRAGHPAKEGCTKLGDSSEKKIDAAKSPKSKQHLPHQAKTKHSSVPNVCMNQRRDVWSNQRDGISLPASLTLNPQRVRA